MEKVKFALLGAGEISSTYVKTFKELTDTCSLVAAADINSIVSAKFTSTYGIECYESIDRLLERKDIDVVIITTPSNLHSEHAIQCMRSGKHVLIDKPFDISLNAIDKCLEVQKETNKQLGVVFQNRFKDVTRTFKKVLDSGVLGKIVYGEMTCNWYRSKKYYDEANWRTDSNTGGGMLLNQAIHFIDLFCWFMGDIDKVSGFYATNKENINIEDTAVSCIAFKNGAIGHIGATVNDIARQGVKIGVVGDKGSLSYDLVGFLTAKYKDFKYQGKKLVDILNQEIRNSDFQYQSFAYILWDFTQSIKTGKKPAVDGYEGRKVIQLIDAIYRSNKNGAVIKF